MSGLFGRSSSYPFGSTILGGAVRRKCFISYHHADQIEVSSFIQTFDNFHDIFIYRGLGLSIADDIIYSTSTDYVMQRIRELYLSDSTVTIVMIGQCTWARRYVDWEIQSSLRQGLANTPNGLLGIKLPSFRNSRYPDRLNANLCAADAGILTDCYARVIDYPNNTETLRDWIEDAFHARTARRELINNPRDRFLNNRTCP